MGQTKVEEEAADTPAPSFQLQLTHGPLAGMSFEIGDWPYGGDEDGEGGEPPGVVWLAEVDRQVVGNVPDKEIRNKVAALERAGLPGWTPYERARMPYTNALQEPQDGVWQYVWAERMDPNAREPRPLQAVG